MTFKEYQEASAKTCANLLEMKDNIDHMSFGIFTESAEIVDVYKKNLAYNKPIDKVNLLEELGDLEWYIVNWLRMLNINEQPEGNSLIHIPTETPIESIYFGKAFKYLGGTLLSICDFDPFNNLPDLYHTYLFLVAKLGFDVKEVRMRNVEKLQKVRYKGGKFTTEEALNRDLNSERETLEN